VLLSQDYWHGRRIPYTSLPLTYAKSDNDLIDNNLYKVTNLTPAKDNSFNVTITTSIRLHIDEEHAPISKPIAHLVGNTTNYADITKAGYTLPIQVKPYLSKDQFQPYTIMLTHPTNGRLKNGLTKKIIVSACNWNFVLFRKVVILWVIGISIYFSPSTDTDGGSQSLGKPLKIKPTANRSLNKELRKYGRNNPQMHRLQLSYLTTPQTEKSDICKLFSRLQTMKILLRYTVTHKTGSMFERIKCIGL